VLATHILLRGTRSLGFTGQTVEMHLFGDPVTFGLNGSFIDALNCLDICPNAIQFSAWTASLMIVKQLKVKYEKLPMCTTVHV